MFRNILNAFKIKDIRKRLIFTLLIIVLVRLGNQIVTPGINTAWVKQWFQEMQNSAFNFFNVITGSSFSTMSIFALNISPYITSSIIVQLLTIAIPRLEELSKEGEEGKKTINKITRYLTVGLAMIQAVSMAIGFGSNYMTNYTWYNVIFVGLVMTAGSAALMWLGERITEKGIGNGISIVLVINIVSRMPQDIAGLFEQFVFKEGTAPAMAVLAALIIVAVIIAVIVLVVLLNSATRKIPVQYAKKMQGRKMVGGQTSNIPLRVNTAGVIPVIFASSLMQLPLVICTFLGVQPGSGFWGFVYGCLRTEYWCKPSEIKYSVGLLLYVVLIVFFAYFYTSITFNPMMVADNMKKQGGFIPGIRPGKPTSDYLNKVLNYIIFIGAIGLTIVAVIPYVFQGIFGAKVSFGGTSLIIVVSVVLETLKQAESLMLVRNYKGFLQD